MKGRVQKIDYNLLIEGVIRLIWHCRTYNIIFMVVQISIVNGFVVLVVKENKLFRYKVPVCLLVVLHTHIVVVLNTHTLLLY